MGLVETVGLVQLGKGLVIGWDIVILESSIDGVLPFRILFNGISDPEGDDVFTRVVWTISLG